MMIILKQKQTTNHKLSVKKKKGWSNLKENLQRKERARCPKYDERKTRKEEKRVWIKTYFYEATINLYP